MTSIATSAGDEQKCLREHANQSYGRWSDVFRHILGSGRFSRISARTKCWEESEMKSLGILWTMVLYHSGSFLCQRGVFPDEEIELKKEMHSPCKVVVGDVARCF